LEKADKVFRFFCFIIIFDLKGDIFTD